MKRQTVVIAILAAALAVMVSTGIRQSFGLFLQPISDSLGGGRESFSLAIAVSNLIYGLPLVGIIADRTGSRWVLAAGGILYGVGLLVLSRVVTAVGLQLSLGLMIGLALSATTYVVVLGAVAQLVPAKRQSSTFGIITATGSSGMFVIPPLAQLLIDNTSWQTALTVLAGVSLIIVLLAFGLPNKAGRETDDGMATSAETAVTQPFIAILKKAKGHVGYLLLTTGFFVCGFHVAFIATHLPAFLSDNGLPTFVAAGALSLVGAFNMVGSFSFGWLGDRLRKKYLLSIIYFGRAVVIALFLLLPITQTSALLFGGAIGFLWLATVPLTSGTVAQIFGVRYLSTLYGIVFLSHQVGAFLGVWLGGRLYDATGTYNLVWYIAIGLSIFAALVHLPITDSRVTAVQSTAAD
ncbi:MFS transporter [Candidatus Leptofilum sp.]|uniref:MFS transporter n=1 Tax=Candidatus Leptofilum sp. TaxID=3241576 RepID=UPI003B5AC160